MAEQNKDLKEMIRQVLNQPKGDRGQESRSQRRRQTRSSQGRRHAQPQREQNRSDGYRFLNPYNFVRPLPDARPTGDVLGDCPPPPHDRYVGLTGRIRCRLTATTPLFVSDSHGVMVEPVDSQKEHLHYRFFQTPDGEVAIPGTSLRGAVRSIFEAVTNSCFAHFAGDKRLSYHLPPNEALKLVPARVRQSGQNWELELLPGTTQVALGQRPSGLQYAAWINVYRPLWRSRSAGKAPGSPYARRSALLLEGWRHGEPCRALIETVRHPLRNFEFWNVVALSKPGGTLPAPGPDQQVVDGYLCITNQNIENKHDERVFFRAPGNTSFAKSLKLPEVVRRRYKELIVDYQERHSDEVRKRKQRGQPVEHPVGRDPGFSRFIVDKEAAKLKDGDLVYAMLNRTGHGTTVQFIVPVSIPRVGYEKTIGALLTSDHLHRCEQYDSLCPACRTFGWVWHSDDPEETRPGGDQPTAYAGRVRISHAKLKKSAGTFDATLAILSTPKPTTSRFYLAPQDGRPENGVDDQRVNYDAFNRQLRGRKVYRHHGEHLSEQEYRSAGGKSDQNRTVHGAQQAGSTFEFTVDFENLAEVELGALLWSLEMEGWHHRIGYAKPLGFGSATVEVTHLDILDPAIHYSSFSAQEGWREQSDWSRWVQAFKQAMKDQYSAPFEQLDNVRDLQALLAETPPLPIHYPRSSETPNPDGKNFEWFVGNKRSGRNAGPRLALDLAVEDTEGLPLLDRFGNEQ